MAEQYKVIKPAERLLDILDEIESLKDQIETIYKNLGWDVDDELSIYPPTYFKDSIAKSRRGITNNIIRDCKDYESLSDRLKIVILEDVISAKDWRLKS